MLFPSSRKTFILEYDRGPTSLQKLVVLNTVADRWRRKTHAVFYIQQWQTLMSCSVRMWKTSPQISHCAENASFILSKTLFVIRKCSSFHRICVSHPITCRCGAETRAQINHSTVFGLFKKKKKNIFILPSAQTVVFGTGSHQGSWPAASETMRCVSQHECFAICLSRWYVVLLCAAPRKEKQEKCFHRARALNLQPGHPCWKVMWTQIRPKPAALWQKCYLWNKKDEGGKSRTACAPGSSGAATLDPSQMFLPHPLSLSVKQPMFPLSLFSHLSLHVSESTFFLLT